MARFAASLKRIPLLKFGPRYPYPSRGRGMVRLKGKTYPGAFYARMSSGHEGIFRRVGKGRLPVKELRGASMGHVFAKCRPQGIARAMEMFDRNFAHELKRLGGETSSASGSD